VPENDFDRGYDKAVSEAAGAVLEMDIKLRRMERMFWAVVAANGGQISVPRSLLVRFERPLWEFSFDEANDAVVYKVTV
jgi:hypothetical protein